MAVIDGFTKFVWLYPTKSTGVQEVLDRLEKQKNIFGSPSRIISDQGRAFTSEEFQKYCRDNGIKHHAVTTGLPRANGQVERLNRTIISVLTKLSTNDPSKWYQHVDRLQQVLNSTYQRTINMTPFELLFGIKMRFGVDAQLKEVIEAEFQSCFQDERDKVRERAEEQITKVQEENRRTYNLRRRTPTKYKLGDLVAIKRTQLGPGRKLKAKFYGPYVIEKVKSNDTYDVKSVGLHEGPQVTSSCAEYMKPYLEKDLSEADD